MLWNNPVDKPVRSPSAEVGTLQTSEAPDQSLSSLPNPPTGREGSGGSCESWEWDHATRRKCSTHALRPLLANAGGALKPRDFAPNTNSNSPLNI